MIAPAIAILGGVAARGRSGAVLASPAMPIGPVRRVEVASGFDADWTVLGLGRAGRDGRPVRDGRSRGVARGPPVSRPRRVTGADTRRVALLSGAAALPPTAAVGLRFAVAPGQGWTAASVRSVMASAVSRGDRARRGADIRCEHATPRRQPAVVRMELERRARRRRRLRQHEAGRDRGRVRGQPRHRSVGRRVLRRDGRQRIEHPGAWAWTRRAPRSLRSSTVA